MLQADLVRRERLLSVANVACWAFGLVLLARNFLAVLAHSVNVPYWDDWAALDQGALDRSLDWSWLISFHNVHRTAWTNLSIWILYRLDGWNLSAHLAANFILFAAFSVYFLRTLERLFAARLGLFLVFAASPLPDEVHLHASNGQWTFAVALSFLAVVFALREDRWAHLAPVLAGAAMLSMGTGMVIAVVALGTLLAGLALVAPDRRRRVAIWAVALIVEVALWAHGYPSQEWPLTPPWKAAFWDHLGVLVAVAFGWTDALRPGIGWTVLALLAASIVLTLVRLRRMDGAERPRWIALSCWALGIAAGAASISLGRAWGGAAGGGSGRYLIIPLFLIAPLWLLVSRQLLAPMPERGRVAVSALLLLLLCAPWVRDFDYSHRYGLQLQRRLAGLACMRRMVRAGLAPACPQIQYDLAKAPFHHQRAIALRLSYLREQFSGEP